jgi:hydrogenase maturation protease
MTLRIIGIGSPHGDDQVGWAAIDALEHVTLPAGTELHRVATPASQLLPLLSGADRVILVDAVASDDPPGSLIECAAKDLHRSPCDLSNHGLSVSAALNVADALGDLPQDVRIVGLAVDALDTPNATMTPVVLAAIPQLVAVVTRTAFAGQR